MSEFSELVRGFCTVAVSGGLMLIMAPDGNLKKYVKFVLSLCMVCALLSAFFTFSEKAEWRSVTVNFEFNNRLVR